MHDKVTDTKRNSFYSLKTNSNVFSFLSQIIYRSLILNFIAAALVRASCDRFVLHGITFGELMDFGSLTNSSVEVNDIITTVG